MPPARGATIGHIAFGITPFDPDQVKAELDKRGLSAREDTGAQGRHPHGELQELSHDDAERIRSAGQRDDACDARAGVRGESNVTLKPGIGVRTNSVLPPGAAGMPHTITVPSARIA